jgi:hypothetical protein
MAIVLSPTESLIRELAAIATPSLAREYGFTAEVRPAWCKWGGMGVLLYSK